MSKFVLNLREGTAVEPAFVESAPAMVEPQGETASKPRRRKLLRVAGLVEIVHESTIKGEPPGYQMPAAAILWKAGAGAFDLKTIALP